jgi:hypothetical protein
MEDDAIGQRQMVFREREIDFEVPGESRWEAMGQRAFEQELDIEPAPGSGPVAWWRPTGLRPPASCTSG